MDIRGIAKCNIPFLIWEHSAASGEHLGRKMFPNILKDRSGNTPIGYVRQAGRDDQQVTVTTLAVVLLGNSQSYISGGKFITPRGYYRERECVEKF